MNTKHRQFEDFFTWMVTNDIVQSFKYYDEDLYYQSGDDSFNGKIDFSTPLTDDERELLDNGIEFIMSHYNTESTSIFELDNGTLLYDIGVQDEYTRQVRFTMEHSMDYYFNKFEQLTDY